jgi:hypothetical protein
MTPAELLLADLEHRGARLLGGGSHPGHAPPRRGWRTAPAHPS